MILIHPPRRALLRFAEAPVNRRSRWVWRHLEACAKCRADVQFVRRLDRLGYDGGPVAGDLLERAIRARLAAGERIILPTGTAQPPAQRRQWAAVAIAATLIMAALLLRPDTQLTAGQSGGTLTFGVPSIVYGRAIPVEYRGGELLSGSDRVVLRARYRAMHDQAYNHGFRQVRAAVLIRGDDDVFRGTILVPDSVVLARFAVESADAARVDANGQKLWSLHLHTATGVPTFESLQQEARDLYGDNFERVLALAREVVRRYPDHPEGWAHLQFLEQFMLGKAYADSVRDDHRARLLALHERYVRQPDLPPDVAHGMDGYAIGLGNGKDPVVRDIGRYWRKRVTADTRRHVVTDLFRVFAAGDSARLDLAGADPLYEALWPEIGWRVPYLATNAWVWASEAKNPAAMLRWADRIVARHPSRAPYYYGEAAAVPAIRQAAMDRLRAGLRPNRALSDSLRSLHRTDSEWRRDERDVLASIHFALGEALIAGGNVRGGLDTLVLAAEGAWNRQTFAAVASAYMAAGEPARAARYLAAITVDPNSPRTTRDSVRTLLGSAVTAGQWAALEAEAAATMRERVLERVTRRTLPGTVRLIDAMGGATNLRALAGGRPAIVTFWSRHCGPSRAQLPALGALARRAAEHGGVLVAITAEEPSAALRAELERLGVTVPVFHDRWAEARGAFRQYATPEYHVIDSAGRLRFERSSADDVVPQLAVLAALGRP